MAIRTRKPKFEPRWPRFTKAEKLAIYDAVRLVAIGEDPWDFDANDKDREGDSPAFAKLKDALRKMNGS